MAKLKATVDITPICERRETYFHTITFYNSSSQLTDPSSVSFYLTSPCNVVLVDLGHMVKQSTGVYQYEFNLSDSSIYGQYNAEVRITDGTTHQIFPDKFFVMPWNIVDEVRSYSGDSEKVINDDDLSLIAWDAFREVIHRLTEYNYHEKLCCCIDGTCSCCGDIECGDSCCCDDLSTSPICSTGYKLKHSPIADWQQDGNVRGCECDDSTDECHNDICGIWIDSNGNCHDVAVDVIDSTCGHVQVYQSDCSTAIPADNKGILLNYHSTWKTYENVLFRKAVAYLAAYEVAIRKYLGVKRTGCDERIINLLLQRLWERYRDIIDSISRPAIGGVK